MASILWHGMLRRHRDEARASLGLTTIVHVLHVHGIDEASLQGVCGKSCEFSPTLGSDDQE